MSTQLVQLSCTCDLMIRLDYYRFKGCTKGRMPAQGAPQDVTEIIPLCKLLSEQLQMLIINIDWHSLIVQSLIFDDCTIREC